MNTQPNLRFNSQRQPGIVYVSKGDEAIGVIFKVKTPKVKNPMATDKAPVPGSYIFLGVAESDKTTKVPTFNLPTYADVKAEVVKRY